MTQRKEVGIRLSVKDRETVERALRGVGREGHEALERIRRAAAPAGEALRSLNATVAGVREGLDRLRGAGGWLSRGFGFGMPSLNVGGLLGSLRSVTSELAGVAAGARRIGLDAEVFQELGYVAERNRISVDALGLGVREMQRRAQEFASNGGGPAAEALQRLGYDAETLATKLRDPSALFTEIIGRLGDLDRATAMGLADRIFGGTGGREFVQLIDQGADGLRRTMEEAREVGAVIDRDLVASAEELDRKFEQIATTVGNRLKGAIVEAARYLGIFLDQFNDIESRTNIRPLQNELAQVHQRRENLRQEIERAEGGDIFPWLNNDSYVEGLRRERGLLADEADRLLSRITELQGRGAQQAPQQLADALPAAPEMPPSPARGGARAGGVDEAQRRRERIAEVIAALREELTLVGATNTERRVMNELRRAGVEAASEEGRTIRGLVEQLSAEEEALANVEDAMRNVGGVARDVLGSILSDLRAGTDATEMFANAYSRLLDRMLSTGLDMGIGALTGLMTGMASPAGAGLFGAAHSGWTVGRGNPPQSRSIAGLPRYHLGGLNPDERLVVARAGEGIFTPRQMDNADGLITALVRNLARPPDRAAAPAPIVEIHNHTGQPVREERSTRGDGTDVRRIIVGEVQTAFADGRMDGVMGGLFGLRRRGH